MNSQDFTSIASAALEMIQDGSVVGLGSGRAATAFVRALGERVRQGHHVRGVPTSQATAILANNLGIPLATLDEVESIDIAVDGADEVAPNLDLIKGMGGALVREKIVASASRHLVILVGTEKLVPRLGSHGILPVEVVPFALPLCQRRFDELGLPSSPRQTNGRNFVSDNGNWILDCKTGPLEDPAGIDQAIRAIPGVVGTGLFLGTAQTVLVQQGDQIEIRNRHN